MSTTPLKGPDGHDGASGREAADAEPTLHSRWPADRFYWSIVEIPKGATVRAGLLPAGLVHSFEDDLPAPVDSVHAVCAPTGAGGKNSTMGVVVCAASTHDLSLLPEATLSLCPASLPEFAKGAVDTSALNLLVGNLEPACMRSVRTRIGVVAAATIFLCAGSMSVALSRRAHAWERRASEALAATDAVVARVVPGGNRAALVRELEAARTQSRLEKREPGSGDAALVLAAVLSGWPSGVDCEAQSITARPESASIAVGVDGDPAPFLEQLRPPSGWSVEEPRINRAGRLAHVLVRLTKTEATP